jgi:hypothetical protein
MAQSGYTPILIYGSGTAGNSPLAANLTSSSAGAELALNYADGKLFYKNSSGAVSVLASNASSTGIFYGLETSTISTPATPTATGSSTGGSLAASTYYFKIVAIDNLGATTLPSSESTVVTTIGSTSSIAIAWTATTGAKSYQVWYSTTTGTQANYFTTTANSYSFTTTAGSTAGTIPSTNTTGNLLFVGTGQRITGDFSNATPANRVSFQNSVSNAGTYIQFIPNGTSQGSGLISYNNSNITNSAYGALTADASMVAIQSAITGTGTYLPMTFYTGGSERMRIDTSGNVLVGTTANTAGNRFVSVGGGIQLSGGTSAQAGLRFQYASSVATITGINNDNNAYNPIAFYTGASEAMRIDSSGNVGIGISSSIAAPLQVYNATSAVIAVDGDTASTIRASRYSADAVGPTLQSRKTRGTYAAPLAVATNDSVGSLLFTAYGGTNYRSVGQIQSFVSTYTSDTNIASSMVFYTNTGSTTVTEKMRITSAGGISFGATGTAYGTSGQLLSSAGNASPTWVDQSTIAAGSATTATTATTANALNTSNTYQVAGLGVNAAGSTSNGIYLNSQSNTVTPILFGAGSRNLTPQAGGMEYRYDEGGSNQSLWFTNNTYNGSGYVPVVNYFRLPSNGSAIGPAINNFFGSTSALTLLSNIVYEFEAYLYFTKTTAGTVTVTITSANAPTYLNAQIMTDVITSGATLGNPSTAALFNSTATGAAFPASGSLTTATNHLFVVRGTINAGGSLSTNIRFNVTSSAGTVTPLAGSYYKITGIGPLYSAGNFVA